MTQDVNRTVVVFIRHKIKQHSCDFNMVLVTLEE